MKAKKKKIAKFTTDELGVTITPHQKILSVDNPPTREGGVKVESVDELLDKLRNVAKVID